MKRTLILAGLIGGLLSTAALADEFSTLEERMTGREFRDTGLHKLTEQELAALNRWIQIRSLAEGESLPAAVAGGAATAVDASGNVVDTRGLRDANARETPITARIIGAFDGWDGDTVFELDNGMVWQQTDGRPYQMSEMENPQVTIEPGIMGSWRLRVDGYNARAQVQRIR
ncbi:MAG: hypothetical protein AAGJ52_00525 [Pseudomonadota bacterium]